MQPPPPSIYALRPLPHPPGQPSYDHHVPHPPSPPSIRPRGRFLLGDVVAHIDFGAIPHTPISSHYVRTKPSHHPELPPTYTRHGVSKKTYRTTLRNPRRAKYAFSPPLSLGKVEGTTVLFTMLVILSLGTNFPTS